MEMRAGTMHRALAIPEVLRTIFMTMGTQIWPTQTYPWWDIPNSSDHTQYRSQDSSRAALANSARTCKGFAEPALDALWETLPSIIPLLSIVGLRKNKDSGIYSFEDGFQSAQWSKLETYAKRVHHLISESLVQFSPIVFVRVAHQSRNSYLLPRLRTLLYPCSPHLFLLASPCLRRLHITSFEGEAWNEFVDGLETAAPPLEEFVSISRNVPPRLSNLRHLHTLRLHDVSWLQQEDLAIISALRSLKTLHVVFDDEQGRIPLPSKHLIYTLRNLKIFGLPVIIHDTLAHLSGTPLESLRLSTSDDFWDKGMAHISSWALSLTHVWLENEWFVDQESPLQDMAVLQPLLELKRLQCLVIRTGMCLDPSNADYHAMMCAWPAINALHLDFGLHTFQIAPRASLSVLQAFAETCPNLKHLMLYLDLSVVPPSPPVFSHPLDTLYIPGGIACDVVILTRYLDRLFPRLRPVIEDLEDIGEEHVDEDWTQLGNLLRLCQDSRSGKIRGT
ncbi:hypothetical protein FPV67DRAFT_1781909 [Lyophyllum atratum]|nr:hypothetical protein FPV67DRAFT_1781909 [Lyophyllum atratum]